MTPAPIRGKMNTVQSMATVRRERMKLELREDILEAARNLFVKEGYEQVSMRKIADEVGCAPGTLYLHFQDKEAILGAICAETFIKLAQRMEAIQEDRSDPLEALRRGGRTYIQFGLEHPHHYWLTFGRQNPHHGKSSLVAQTGNRCFDGLRGCVRRAVEAGTTRSDDVECIAQVLWSGTHGMVMLLLSKSGFPFIEQTRLIESALDMMIEGIRAR